MRIFDPDHVWVDSTVVLGEEVELHPGCKIESGSRIESRSVIRSGAQISNSHVGEGSEIKAGSVLIDSKVGNDCKLGPYAHLRPGSSVGDRTKIGNFVELKESRIGEDTSIAHLSYVGDAKVGNHVNIGCGFVTCNFDGRVVDGKRKHETVIEDGVFLGSDCQTIAPVKIGKGAYVASGSTITEDVEDESLAIARSRQVNKPGYAKKLKNQKQ